MYSSTTIHIKNLSADDIKTLNLLSSMIAELYNNCINFIKSNYENDNYIPDDVSLYREMSKTTAFSNLGKSYVYTLNIATQNFKTSIRKHLKLPNSQKQYHGITLKGNEAHGTYVKIPSTKYTKELIIPIPPIYQNLEVSIFHIKRCSADYWELILTYKSKLQIPDFKKVNFVGVDLGLENLITAVCSNGNTVIFDGRKCKFIHYQKLKATSKKQYYRLRNQMTDYINKVINAFIQFCIENEVKAVLVGNGFSRYYREGYMDKYCKEIPYDDLQAKLKDKCLKYGIKHYTTSECYTSKASFIDNDITPLDLRGTKKFSGKRKKRGVYVSKDGYILNADVNGAYNILNHSHECDLSHLQNNPKLIKQPKRIRF